ncbi:MAG: hypothetical protein Q8911_03160 [Bacillota bacterium]|nr:hypothetical protein [Bacillota bacterium]
MIRCPNCNLEYQEGQSFCSNCKIPLIDELVGRPKNEPDCETFEEWVFLISCSDDQEANMIESFLACENIFLLRKYGGAGDYLRVACGMTIFGVDLFVRKSQFKTAKDIVREVYGIIDETDHQRVGITHNDSAANEVNKGKKRLYLFAFIYIVFILVSLIVTIVLAIKNFIG